MDNVKVKVFFLVFFLVCWYGHGLCRSEKCVQDDLGKTVCAKKDLKRIVSFAPSFTELVFSLGAGDLLVGRSARCNFPREAQKVQVVGGYMRPDLERTIALNPDLVLTTKRAAGKEMEMVHRLEALGIPVFVAESQNIDEILTVTAKLGKLLSRESQADTLIADARKRRSFLKKRLSGLRKPKVLFVVGTRPLVVAGGDSFLGAIVREAGGINVLEKTFTLYPRLSMEEVIRKDPQVIVVLNKDCKKRERCFERWLGLTHLQAVKNDRMHILQADLVARPSLKIVEAVETLASIIHPELAQQIPGNTSSQARK